jgi:hypothetical protein
MPGSPEQREVTPAELRAGIPLSTGQRIVLVVDRQTHIAVALRGRSAELLSDVPFRISAGGRSREGRCSDRLVELDVPGTPSRCLVEWGNAGDPDLGTSPPFRLELYIDYAFGSDEEQARKRLHNIGYPDRYAFDVALSAFQRDHGLPVTGVLDDASRTALIEAHGTLGSTVGTGRSAG